MFYPGRWGGGVPLWVMSVQGLECSVSCISFVSLTLQRKEGKHSCSNEFHYCTKEWPFCYSSAVGTNTIMVLMMRIYTTCIFMYSNTKMEIIKYTICFCTWKHDPFTTQSKPVHGSVRMRLHGNEGIQWSYTSKTCRSGWGICNINRSPNQSSQMATTLLVQNQFTEQCLKSYSHFVDT